MAAGWFKSFITFLAGEPDQKSHGEKQDMAFNLDLKKRKRSSPKKQEETDNDSVHYIHW